MSERNIDIEPVYVVTDAENKLVEVGNPDYADKQEMGTYIREGYSIIRMTLGEYKALNLKWVWEK